ncbi:MAG: hypothetical protein ABEJ79_02415 [Halolamina sp.]
MDDRRLTDFVGDGEDDAEDGDADSDNSADATIDSDEDDANSADSDAEPANVEPAAVTFAWSPEGGECAVCGDTVARRWRRETAPGRVCADCKEW